MNRAKFKFMEATNGAKNIVKNRLLFTGSMVIMQDDIIEKQLQIDIFFSITLGYINAFHMFNNVLYVYFASKLITGK
jgi:hypothetical protein